ncbi:MAG: RusA family crossover junction endodeoxyribonuclease [Bacillota bacterium]
MDEIKIVVPGRPVAKARPRIGYAGRKVMLYTPEETVEYERRVHTFGRLAMQGRELVRGLVVVTMRLYFARRARKSLPDTDNVVKAILDGLSGAVYVDDQQVARIVAERFIDRDERAEIVVEEVEYG